MPHKQFADAPNYWHVPLCETCFLHPWEFIKACVCPCCYSFCQRLDIYEGDIESKYQCCGGAYGCDDCFVGRSCPRICLCLEVICCFWCSVYGNRFLIQSMYQVRNTMFETFMIWMMCICSFVICILSFFISGLRDEFFQCLCDMIYLAFSACLQTQQHCELSHQRKGPKGTEMNNM